MGKATSSATKLPKAKESIQLVPRLLQLACDKSMGNSALVSNTLHQITSFDCESKCICIYLHFYMLFFFVFLLLSFISGRIFQSCFSRYDHLGFVWICSYGREVHQFLGTCDLDCRELASPKLRVAKLVFAAQRDGSTTVKFGYNMMSSYELHLYKLYSTMSMLCKGAQLFSVLPSVKFCTHDLPTEALPRALMKLRVLKCGNLCYHYH